VDQAAAALGGLDVLVNNAGVYVKHQIAEVSYQEWQAAWRDVLGVNLTGAANVTWCAVRHMIAGGRGGRIVNVSSRGAFRGEPRHPAYGASKAGLNAFGQSLARDLARTASRWPGSPPGMWRPTWPPVSWRARAGTRSGRRARSGGWPGRTRSPRRWSTSPRRRRNGPAALSSTSTEPPTCGLDFHPGLKAAIPACHAASV